MNRFDVLIVLFLFMVGCIAGWFGELFFNRFISKRKKWVNPGFLQGPYLPIYGFGTVILYILSYLLNRFTLGSLLFDVIFIFFVAMIIMTLLELIGGEFFTHFMHIRLWDYSEEKFNYKGIICLRFSILWGVVSILYYFLVNPLLVRAVSLYTSHIEFSFVIGMFYGFILIDLFQTMGVSTRIRKLAKDNEIIVTYLKLKDELALDIKNNRKAFFRMPDGKDIREYIENIKNHHQL